MQDYDPTPTGSEEADFIKTFPNIDNSLYTPIPNNTGREYRYQFDKSLKNGEMFHVRCDDWKEFTKALSNMQSIIPQAEAFPNDTGKVATPPEKTVLGAPTCPIHNKVMTLRQGQYGNFFSCSTKLENGTWCNYKPPKPTK